MSKPRRNLVGTLLALLLLCVAELVAANVPQGDGLLHVYILDVGQGDAVLVVAPDGAKVLIDTGVGAEVLSELDEVLASKAIALDALLLTHADADHIGQAESVTFEYRPSLILVNKTYKQSRHLEALYSRTDGLRVSSFAAGNELQIGCCVKFHALWPPEPYFAVHETDANEQSIAGILSYGEFEMYLGGDLGALELTSVRGIDSLEVEVLKLGHHGSDTSSSAGFLDKLRPQVGLISAGEGNSYGHPHQSVLDRLKDRGIAYFGTYEQGRIELVTDGQTYFSIFSEKSLEQHAYKLYNPVD